MPRLSFSDLPSEIQDMIWTLSPPGPRRLSPLLFKRSAPGIQHYLKHFQTNITFRPSTGHFPGLLLCPQFYQRLRCSDPDPVQLRVCYASRRIALQHYEYRPDLGCFLANYINFKTDSFVFHAGYTVPFLSGIPMRSVDDLCDVLPMLELCDWQRRLQAQVHALQIRDTGILNLSSKDLSNMQRLQITFYIGGVTGKYMDKFWEGLRKLFQGCIWFFPQVRTIEIYMKYNGPPFKKEGSHSEEGEGLGRRLLDEMVKCFGRAVADSGFTWRSPMLHVHDWDGLGLFPVWVGGIVGSYADCNLHYQAVPIPNFGVRHYNKRAFRPRGDAWERHRGREIVGIQQIDQQKHEVEINSSFSVHTSFHQLPSNFL